MNERRKQALSYFVQQGWTKAQAAGIVANLEAESGLREDAVGDGGRAYGIAQHHPPRQADFSAIMGKDIRGSSFEEQLAFVHAELRNTEKAAGDALAHCVTAAEAGACVSMMYERPADRDGEAAKRAALAERIYQEFTGVAAEVPAAAPPIPSPIPPSRGSIPPQEKPIMGAGLILGLVQAALGVFAPLAQQKITAELARHSDPATAGAVAQNVMDAIQKATGQTDPIAATAAIQKAPSEVIQAAQEDALGRLDRMAPFIDKLAQIERQTAQDDDASRDAASIRAGKEGVDLATPLTYAGLGVIGLLILFVGAIIVAQVVHSGSASTEAWAALTGLIGWTTGQVSLIYAYRFGTTRTSGAKDILIGELARK